MSDSTGDQWTSTGAASPGHDDSYDAAAVPIRNAATVLIVADRPDLHVLMLKRNARSVFVGDMWVYPGGAVDPDDGSERADALVAGRSNVNASETLGIDHGGIAYWVAVLRETFEEAGVLLARPAATAATSPLIDLSEVGTEARFTEHRHALNGGLRPFLDIVEEEGLELDGSGVHYVGRWLTPIGPPRRYDTRFFVTAMPEGQAALHDDDEVVHSDWVRPADALAASEAGEMVMMTPTLSMLQRLARYDTAADAIAAAANATPADDEQIRIRYNVDTADRIAYPGDADYADADPTTEFGAVRWPATPTRDRPLEASP